MSFGKNSTEILLIKGDKSRDDRGTLFHNNQFDFSPIRRSYIIENSNLNYFRGWKGHNIENRWFICVKGSIEVYVATIDNLENKNEEYRHFKLNEDKMDVLFVPSGHATLIKQITVNSRIMAFSDWPLGESNDENWRFPNNIFEL